MTTHEVKMMKRYRLTVPNDYDSSADFATLATWCNARGREADCDFAFDAADAAWPEATRIDATSDWSQIFESPTPPPTESEDFPPLWCEPLEDED